MRLIIVALLFVAACGEAPAPVVKRAAPTQMPALQKPEVRVHRFDDGELRVLEVPVHVTRGGFVERQTCFLWRDTEFRTTSLQCPAGIEGPPEHAQ